MAARTKLGFPQAIAGTPSSRARRAPGASARPPKRRLLSTGTASSLRLRATCRQQPRERAGKQPRPLKSSQSASAGARSPFHDKLPQVSGPPEKKLPSTEARTSPEADAVESKGNITCFLKNFSKGSRPSARAPRGLDLGQAFCEAMTSLACFHLAVSLRSGSMVGWRIPSRATRAPRIAPCTTPAASAGLWELKQDRIRPSGTKALIHTAAEV